MQIDHSISPFNVIIESYLDELESEFGKFPMYYESTYEHLKKKIFNVTKYHLFLKYSFYKQLHSKGIFKVNNLHEKSCKSLLDKHISKSTLPTAYEKCINQIYQNTKIFINELCHNFEIDKILIYQRFNIYNNSSIVDVIFLGDTHNRGRAALKLLFSDSSSLIFKPNEIKLSKTVENVLEPYKDLFFIPKKIERKSYYWEEFINSQTSNIDNSKISCALGILLGFTQITCFSDLHYENILIQNNKIVLFDFETLFDYNSSTLDKIITVCNSSIKLGDTPMISSILPIWFKGIDGGYANYCFIGGPAHVNYVQPSLLLNKSGFVIDSIIHNNKQRVNINIDIVNAHYASFIQNFDIQSVLSSLPKFIKKRKVLRSTKEYAFIIDNYFRDNSTSFFELLSYRKLNEHHIQQEINQLKTHCDIPYFIEQLTKEQIELNLKKSFERAKLNTKINEKIISLSIQSHIASAENIVDILKDNNYSLKRF